MKTIKLYIVLSLVLIFSIQQTCTARSNCNPCDPIIWYCNGRGVPPARCLNKTRIFGFWCSCDCDQEYVDTMVDDGIWEELL